MRGGRPALALEHHANAGDDLGGAAAVGDDARESGTRLIDIRRCTGEPAQASLSVGGDRRQRLVDLMHDRGCHLVHRHALGDTRHFGASLAERVDIGHVTRAADEQHVAVACDWRDRQFERAFLAVPAQSGNLDAPAQNHGLSGLQIALEAVLMRVPIALRNDQIGHRTSDDLLARPSEDTDSAIIPVGDCTGSGHDHDGVERRLQQQTQPFVEWRRARSAPSRSGEIRVRRHGRPKSCPFIAQIRNSGSPG